MLQLSGTEPSKSVISSKLGKTKRIEVFGRRGCTSNIFKRSLGNSADSLICEKEV